MLISFTAIAIVGLIYVFIFSEAISFANNIGISRLFTDDTWNPTNGKYNIIPIIAGTLFTTSIAIIIAGPVGIASAILGLEFRTYRRTIYRRCLEVLGGIPSVVIGLWGLTTIVPLILKIQAPGASLLAGGLVLSLMVVPTVALVSLSAFESVSDTHIKTGHALGFSRWSVVWRIIVPQSKKGIATGLILGIGRALGETMVVLMVCGNVIQIPGSLFDPVRTLTANIALEMAYALDDHRGALFATAAVLLVFVTIFVVISDRFSSEIE